MSPTKSAKMAMRLLPLALLAVALLMSFPSNAFALFNNGGFENGNFTGGWATSTFLNPGLSGSAPFSGANIVRNSGGSNLTSVLGPFTTEMSQSDPNTGNALHYPLAGKYCAQVNFQGANRNGNTLTQTTTALSSDVQTDGSVHVDFGWAAVVENPGHSANEQPYVYVAVRDLTKSTLLYEKFIFAGDGSIWQDVPGSANGVQYTNWQVIDVAPAPSALAVGDSVQIEVTAAGCSLGGHWGYVYVDHFGSFKQVTAQVTVPGKAYDGTTAATVTGGTLTGVQGSDDVSLNVGGAAATFDTATPGTGKTVTVSGLTLNGADADKYMLTSNTVTTTADISSPATVGLQAAATDLKPGGTTTVTAAALDSLGNPMSGQTITFSTSSGSVSPLTAVTDANGQATATFTAGATGAVTVTAAAYGGVHDTAPLFVDSTPPVTTASNTQATASSGWVDHGVSVTLAATDNSGGGSTTYYVLDGTGSPILYTGAPVLVSGDGSHELDYWSVDGAGNAETHHVSFVNIDSTAPSTTVSGNDSAWHKTAVTLGFSATDAGSGMTGGLAGTEYQIDSGPIVSGTGVVVPAPGDGSDDGVHTVTYYSTDALGNLENTHAVSVKIDTAPPITNVQVDRDATSGDVTIAFLPSDLGSGMAGGSATTQYQVDGGGWVTGTQVVLQPLSDHSTDGPHTVTYRSIDALGNIETSRSATVTLATPSSGGGAADGTITPQTAVLGLTGLWRSSTAHLTFQAYEDPTGPGVAHTEYSLDNGSTWETGTSLEIDAPADHSNDGPHLVCFRSVDKAGTVEPTHIVMVGIDTLKPTVVAQATRTAWANKPFTLAFAASDATPGSGIAHIEWSTTGGSWASTGSSMTVAARGVTSVLYRAVDDAGNVGDTQVTYVRIDTSRPWTKALRSTGLRHRRVSLRFRIYDGKPTCGKARVTLIVVKNAHGKVVARLRKAGLRKVNARSVYKVRLKLAKGRYRFTVRATDIAGNRQSRAIAGTLVIR
jgi:hypothetical protein